MKKCVAIITLNGDKLNYGNKLQNFAIIKQLAVSKFKPITINLQKKSLLKVIIKYLVSFAFKRNNHKYYRKQIKFYTFEIRYLKYHNNSSRLIKKIDYYLIGSDQVWNPNYWNINTTNFYLGNFDSPKKKIAISVSMGTTTISKEASDLFKKNMRNFLRISCRESSVNKFLLENCSTKSEITIDPVLSLTDKEWLKYAKPAKGLDYNSYALAYFVGVTSYEIPNDIKAILNKENVKIIDVNMTNNCAGPFEFIGLIKNAKIILTNSYHATLFSFIFNRPFVVFKREENDAMFVRISEFLNRYSLNDKKIDCLNFEKIFDCNYLEAKKNLNQEINKFKNFISLDNTEL